jgi:hypothetical protein
MGIRRCNLKRKAASASEAGDSGLKRKLANASESEDDKILKVSRRRVRSKKEYMAAEDEAMAKLPPAYRPPPTVQAAEPTGKKKKKKVLVKRLVAREQIDALLAMHCPITPNELTEEQLAGYPKSFQDLHNQEMNIAKKLRDYHQALIDQYAEYGYAVDESEAEVTDDEGDDDDS